MQRNARLIPKPTCIIPTDDSPRQREVEVLSPNDPNADAGLILAVAQIDQLQFLLSISEASHLGMSPNTPNILILGSPGETSQS